jgi:hypothetical protein
MDSAPRFAEKRSQDAAELTHATYQAMSDDSRENIRAYERFYNNLALFSGGTMALSVTRPVLCPVYNCRDQSPSFSRWGG